jgi:hypothetical protein
MLVGTFLKGEREKFQLYVIRLNNRLVRAQWSRMNNRSKDFLAGQRKILLLLPHCLQMNECEIRLTYNINNCQRCGKCEIKELLQISEERNLSIFVATGGTIARRIVNDVRPDAIVAVACERDLSSGIVDTFPLPVLGIANERPFGPCVNTRVDLDEVKEALEFFSNHRIAAK